MADENQNATKKTCFVVMGFGKKTDFETGRVLDLDKSYKYMIKPAVEAAGLTCIRADEIVHSGLIDVPMYEQLLNADVVVADLSTSNKNAFYELGVRHALRPFTTVVIAEDGIKTFPFDISHVAVRQYHHLGEDIGFEEVMRFREQLTNAVTEILKKNPVDKDSPVYTYLNNLTPPALAAAVQAKVQEAVEATQSAVTRGASGLSALSDANSSSETHSYFIAKIDEAQASGDWLTAKTLLSTIRQMKKDELKKKVDLMKEDAKKRGEEAQTQLMENAEDPDILQRLALATYKEGATHEDDPDYQVKALKDAHQLLHLLNPYTSNDTETLGLWGSVHKQLWDLTKDPAYLNEAIRAYERGFYIRNDYYNGINFAFLLNVRAAQATDPAEAIADFVEAGRIRKEVLQISEQWLKDYPIPDAEKADANALKEYLKSWYWVKASIGEAYVGLGDEATAQTILTEAYAKAPVSWMKGSTEDQLNKLRPLLANSPLQYIKRS